MLRTKKNTDEKNMDGTGDTEKLSNLRQFFLDELKDIYWAEKLLVKTLPEMKEEATNRELKKAISDHVEQTKIHVRRIELVFESIEEMPEAVKCEAMRGLVEEGETVISNTVRGTNTRDVGLIIAAQKIEHYEIATYGSLVELARTIGLNKAYELLQETLEEEKATDQRLTEIAQAKINERSLEEQKA